MKKGFTLIELLVVVLIIGILAAVALPQYTKAVEKSRSAEAMTLLSNLANAEKVYMLNNGGYTADVMSLDYQFPSTASGSSSANSFNTKNFKISVTKPVSLSTPAAQFSATAERLSGQTYKLMLDMDSAGNISRTCTGSEIICKALSGAVCSSKTVDWCYVPSSSYNGEIGGEDLPTPEPEEPSPGPEPEPGEDERVPL